MSGVEWLACADEATRGDVELAAASLGAGGKVEYLESVDEMRVRARMRPGTVWGILGGTVDGLSDINGAAACVADGTLRSVSLVRRGASGSFRSRAARAGVDLVIDPAELGLSMLSSRGSLAGPADASQPGGAAGEKRPAREARGGDGSTRCSTPGSRPRQARLQRRAEPARAADSARRGDPARMAEPQSKADRGGGAAVRAVSRQAMEPVPQPARRQPEVGEAAGEPPARRRIIPSPPEVKGRAPVIVLASGRGGVGKTCLSAAFSAAAASWGMGVLALDLDLSCGNLYTCFGMPGGQDLSRLAEEGDFSGVGAPACDGVRVAGPCERPELADAFMPRVQELVCSASSMADLVVVDTSTTFTEATAQAMQLADRLLLVSDGRPGQTASVARASGLAVRLGVARTRIARLENRSDPRARRPVIAGRAEIGLEGARTFYVEDGGAEVLELMAAGQASQMLELGVPFAESAATVLAQILTELGGLPRCEAARKALEAGEPKRKSFFGRKKEARSA